MNNLATVYWIALICLGLAVIFAMTAFGMLAHRHKASVNRLAAELDALNKTLNALCSGAVGLDRRTHRLEKGGRNLQQRLDNLEQRWQSERPYGEAIQQVHRGATASRLIDEYGLSPHEADLIVMLHGQKKAS